MTQVSINLANADGTPFKDVPVRLARIVRPLNPRGGSPLSSAWTGITSSIGGLVIPSLSEGSYRLFRTDLDSDSPLLQFTLPIGAPAESLVNPFLDSQP